MIVNFSFGVDTSDPLYDQVMSFMSLIGKPPQAQALPNFLPPEPAKKAAQSEAPPSVTPALAAVTAETGPAKQPDILADTDLIGTSKLWDDFKDRFYLPLLKALGVRNKDAKGLANALEKLICQKWGVSELRKLTIGQSKEVRQYVTETGEAGLLKLIVKAHK